MARGRAGEKGAALERTGQVLFIGYPPCSTCKKAERWLDEHGIAHINRHIVEDNPTAQELEAWHRLGGVPLRRLFNTSGKRYRELGIKEKLDAGMSDEECYELLASDGMLVKRPMVIGKNFVLVGFKEAEWAERLLG